MNEPSKYDTEPATLQAFSAWLERKYESVQALNRAWFRQVKKISQKPRLPLTSLQAVTGGLIIFPLSTGENSISTILSISFSGSKVKSNYTTGTIPITSM